ncbi:MAG TPA: RHS repeat-associated core domain-containing protein, partial [Candidatus Nanopelagicales bacterium]|nr:RHS repeat-associated core domain-containing protein [Candidatus Nanopelagicales bacterium]
FTYDGHLPTDVSWSGAVSGTLHRVYNHELRVTSETVNGGNTVALGYDADGLLTSAGPLSLSRDAQNGRVTGLIVGGVVEALSFDGFGDLSGRVVTGGGSTLLSVSYVRDALGRIIEKTETIGGETHVEGYVFDLAGRLSEVYRDGLLAASYVYDDNGNRLTKATPAEMLSGAVDAQDRLLTYGTLSFTYAERGVLQCRTDAASGGTTLYAYDPLGNLRQVTLPSGAVIDYVVDGTGRRVGKKVNGVLARGWLYRDALQPAAELDAGGAVVARFVYGERVNVPDAMVKGGITYRLVTDHLGSVRLVVDAATGVVAQRIDYDEFGRVVLDTSPGFQPFGFAGGLYDPDTGLTRFGARDYDAETGRWTAKDPLLFEGGDTNLYVYALGDPVNRVDYTGRSSDALKWFFTGVLAAEAPLVVPALASTGIFGLCILMALTLEDDTASEDDVQRCKRVRTQCAAECSDKALPTWKHDGMPFHKCYRQCVEAQNCWGVSYPE